MSITLPKLPMLDLSRDNHTSGMRLKHSPAPSRRHTALGAAMGDAKSCGICGNWDHSKKRNCSNPGTPVYYSQCLYPVEQLVLPHCVVFEETHAESGTNCPCFVPLSTNLGASK